MAEKPEVPEKIWVENLNANYRHLYNCSLTNPDDDKNDHRIMDEYILKSVSDKKVCEAYGKGYDEGYGKGYNFAKDDEEKEGSA